MAENLLVCLNCGQKYRACLSCESMRNNRVWTYKQDFCSAQCFREYEKRDIKMRILRNNNKTYAVKKYDVHKKELTLTNEETIKEDEVKVYYMEQADLDTIRDNLTAHVVTAKPAKVKKVTKKAEESEE